MTPALACVVDASVGIKLFLAQDLSERAGALFAHLAGDPQAHLSVPDLFYIECASILWKHTRRFGYPLTQASQSMLALSQLDYGEAATRLSGFTTAVQATQKAYAKVSSLSLFDIL